ncbi:MFS transporter [Pedobacter yulinensis]|uniref:MFS transporter n=1 Tax=Pedobacter yulinensis TaxID=2126353 RepID=A0A2T3HQG7_9SPHI|nr:MFS transporter [Pedobacter yulinensis]PST84666.1 MFS transporter [Pedobacter yulinensis]
MSAFLLPERRRWLIIGVIFLAIVFNYVDRQIVSILKPVLKKEFKLGDDGYAVVVNIFTVCYALMYPVTGWLVDRFGPRLVMLWGVLTWSLACIGGGIARNFAQFTFFRGLLGLAEPSNFPAQIRVVTMWFPGKIRATANSLCAAGSSIGAIIAPPFIAWLAIEYDWHTVFIVSGLIGVAIAVLWWFVYRDPPGNILKESAGSVVAAETEAFTWRRLWTTRSLYGVLLIRFISDPVWYFCLFWLPGYLQESSGLSLAQVGMVGWIPFLAADLGGIGMSMWSDWLVRRGREPLKARKIMLTVAATLAPLCALTPFLPGAAMTLLVFSVVAAVCLSWLFTVSVVIAEAFPVRNSAGVLGIAGGFGAVGAVLFNYFVGQYIGSIGAGKLFLVMAFLHPLAAVVLWTMVRKEKPPTAVQAF